MLTMPYFERYIGIDYSGAETPNSGLKGLRIYCADLNSEPIEVFPKPGQRKYWTRRNCAEWLKEMLSEDKLALVGIDHGFSFPIQYFEAYGLSGDWNTFLEDFQRHWPTDQDNVYVDFVRDGHSGDYKARHGNSRWKRLTEYRAGSAKSVFHFDVPGSVAKSTHAGLPWLHFLRQEVGDKVHFWPFDGWELPGGKSVIFEVYPSLWSKSISREERTQDQHDAYSVSYWLKNADLDGSLASFCSPTLSPPELKRASMEGWILGIM